ncbi:predicted protein [Naegleria gruberi]|uniref:Predicted protein n=1 Tax=Naegleria gruberi TaxID=5762 RepID=D2VKC6_NAEGR|nr:uncharacterized protein NAEGRDRAFT_69347 [Naegleria gruberi]EFC42576.1 predicted protein [Naegleria gruberi]|eukprot:XP_002675320.1 predicted protein [Naegleria gruberi strain NEG-M]
MAPQRSMYDLQGPPINNPYIKQGVSSTTIDNISSSGSGGGIKSIFQTLTQLSSNPDKAIKVISAVLLVIGGGSLIKILFGGSKPVKVVEKEVNGFSKKSTGKIVPQRYAGLRNEGATC